MMRKTTFHLSCDGPAALVAAVIERARLDATTPSNAMLRQEARQWLAEHIEPLQQQVPDHIRLIGKSDQPTTKRPRGPSSALAERGDQIVAAVRDGNALNVATASVSVKAATASYWYRRGKTEIARLADDAYAQPLVSEVPYALFARAIDHAKTFRKS